MDELFLNKKLDVVDFDGLKLLMFKNDNLYNHFIPKARKNQSLEGYYKTVHEKHEYPVPTITYLNCEEGDDPAHGVFIFFKHLLSHGQKFTVLDIGSHVGDFALKCGHFFRNAQQDIKVISFDPSPAGLLVPMNIEINALENHNRHEKLAITQQDGTFIFNFREGYSDSAKLNFSKKNNLVQKIKFYWGSTLRFKFTIAQKLFLSAFKRTKSIDIEVEGQSLESYFKKHSMSEPLFIKLDVEGYDEVLVREIIKLKNNRLISLISELQVDVNSLSFLHEISEHFYIFDLFYCPNPTRFQKIDPEHFEAYIRKDLKNREYGYTDLFLLDKHTPGVDELMNKLTRLKKKKDQMVL